MTAGGRTVSAAGTVSGAASIAASWQVCHAVCTALIALLAVLGITVAGMPLAFLQEWQVPLWTLAAVLWLVVAYLYVKKRCISWPLLVVNTGLVVAGIPLPSVQWLWWTLGATVIVAGLLWGRRKKKRCCHEK